MNYKAMFKGEHIGAAEFDGKKPTVVIKSVTLKVVEGDDGTKKQKCFMQFEGWDRGFLPSKTVAICIAAMFGDDVEKWVGKAITLHATMVKFGKDTVPGIRVFGSPDISAPLQVEIKLPKKKPQHVTLQVTKKGASAQIPAKPAQPAAAPPPPPPAVDEPPADVVLPGQSASASSIDDAAERFAGL